MQSVQKILVVGATGGTGRAVVAHLLQAGHHVTAFARSADTLAGPERLTTWPGDATNPSDVERAVRDHDAVVVTLGITENPLRVRVFGAVKTPPDVRSVGTRHVVQAMQKHGVRRLVVQSSYGVGPTRSRLRAIDRVLFRLLLKPQIEDTERQEQEVRQSGLAWVLAQPVHLTDDESAEPPVASAEGRVEGWKVSRRSVARFLGDAAVAPQRTGRTVALSGRGAA